MGYRVQVFAWSSIAQLVCKWAFSLLVIWCLRLPSFESCIQQRRTTFLLSIRKSLACARASKLTTKISINTMNICITKKPYSTLYQTNRLTHLGHICQKVVQHTGGKWLIHGTKCHKDSYVTMRPLCTDILDLELDCLQHICWLWIW